MPIVGNALPDMAPGHSGLRTIAAAAQALAQLDAFEPDLILTHWSAGAATVPVYGSAAEKMPAGLKTRADSN